MTVIYLSRLAASFAAFFAFFSLAESFGLPLLLILFGHGIASVVVLTLVWVVVSRRA